MPSIFRQYLPIALVIGAFSFAQPVSAQGMTEPTLEGLLSTVLPRNSGPADSNAVPSEISVGTDQGIEETVRLVLSLSDREVSVYRGEALVESYPVAVGREGWETPTGEFSVFHKLEDPGWTNPLTSEVMPPGPNNPLGDRWMAFWTDDVNVIGFHGTPNRDSVGTAASHGCVRMYNEDIRELYEIVDVGTSVTVVH